MFNKTIIGGLLLLGASTSGAFAANSSYEANFAESRVTIASITVTASEDVRNETKQFDLRDVDMLKQVLQTKVERQLSKKGVMAQTGARLELVITNLKPNRPTMAQYRAKSGLSYQSYALGGASLEGHLISASGQDLGSVDFTWEESWIDQVQGATTWYDARRAFDRFSRRLARELAQKPAS
jgi:hypothetical protein